ncbi:MAG: MFS transporter [Elusimicrobiota bacterium]
MRSLAAALSLCIAVEPALGQVLQAPVQSAPVLSNAAGAGLVAPVQLRGLTSLSLPVLSNTLGTSLPGVRALTVSAPVVTQVTLVEAAPRAAATGVAARRERPAAKTFLKERVQPLSAAVQETVRDLPDMAAPDAHGAADTQFRTLIGEPVRPVAAALAFDDIQPAGHETLRLSPAMSGEAAEEKVPLGKVFRDPERNRSFWLYTAAYAVYTLGYQMATIGLPYLVSAFTRGALQDARDPRLDDAAAVQALIRENRNLARMAHRVAQVFSYVGLPLIVKDDGHGPKRWLTRAAFLRAAVLGCIPLLFYSTGLVGGAAALWMLFGLLAVQSFFQAIYATMDAATTARLMGDPSVQPAERMRANSILTGISSVMAVLGPVLAGQFARIGSAAGPVLYLVYAAGMGLAGLFLAAMRMRHTAAVRGPQGAAVSVRASLRSGLKLILGNKFLRAMLGLTLLAYLFYDPMFYAILPEFAESLAGTAWFSSSIGKFGLMMATTSVGSIAASALSGPLRKLLSRFGFKTEESLLLPFGLIALLEAPFFWLMLQAPSILWALPLVVMQTLSIGFSNLLIAGLTQKTLGGFSADDVNSVVAVRAVLNILAAVLGTSLFGFVLKGMPLSVSLTLCLAATAAMGLYRLAAPWLILSREQRARTKA